MSKEISKGDAGHESPRSDSKARTPACPDADSPMHQPGESARWALGLAAFAWLAWVGFLVAMLMAHHGGFVSG